jgi:hypothetical protein
MSKEELMKYFDSNTDKSYLMRSIIISEINYPKVDYERTLRGLWYSTVKPTLDKLGLLSASDQTEEGLTKWDAVLSKYVADLLRKGCLTYKDLRISDTSRQKENPVNRYQITDLKVYGYQVTASPYSNIIIATEKDTVYNIISGLAQLFGCSCISSKGQNSLGAMEKLIRGINFNKDNTLYILTMTDYDPAGYYIADALETQARDILSALNLYDVEVMIERIGITPDQLDFETVEANKYTPKPANLEKWFEITNGINGEPKGLELDALTPEQIRSIFVNRLMPYIDANVYKDFVKKSAVREFILEHIEDEVNVFINDLVEDVYDDFNIKSDMNYRIDRLAMKGYRSLPTNIMCDFDLDVVEEKIRERVNEVFYKLKEE